MEAATQRKIENYISKALANGTDPEDILQKLQSIGLSPETAYSLYKKMELQQYFIFNEASFKEKQKRLAEAKKNLGSESMIKIESVMNSPVQSIEKGELLSKAIGIMATKDIGCLVVTERLVPVGMLTERDLLKKVLAKAAPAASLRVQDVMSGPLIYATTDDRLIDVENKMHMNKLKRIPILKDGKLVGIITSSDIIRMVALV